ncbi:hypothetical protein T458_26620 [Brevibacillus panacihumi W25]|uniref:Phospholipase D-like domain-containing protein n=1 Tax=Brevibacillus panacihumi W25 TaxID=1408254 RepID=V6M1I8_9BACL|nr:phospholipase D-like domain-containing protein [Brevibacillus panacihumi]EST52207.1 hypothetical protein T458_26620 [Brevibacillus panacihumi W25]
MAIKAALVRGVRVRLVPRHVVSIIVGAASRTGEIAEIGSSNFDLRSYRLNYEVCEVVYRSEVARKLAEQFEHDLADSIPLRMEVPPQRTHLQRILDQTACLLSPII